MPRRRLLWHLGRSHCIVRKHLQQYAGATQPVADGIWQHILSVFNDDDWFKVSSGTIKTLRENIVVNAVVFEGDCLLYRRIIARMMESHPGFPKAVTLAANRSARLDAGSVMQKTDMTNLSGHSFQGLYLLSQDGHKYLGFSTNLATRLERHRDEPRGLMHRHGFSEFSASIWAFNAQPMVLGIAEMLCLVMAGLLDGLLHDHRILNSRPFDTNPSLYAGDGGYT